MKTRPRRPRAEQPLPGIPAQYAGECPRCPKPIKVGDRVAFIRGRALHVACFSGADDE